MKQVKFVKVTDGLLRYVADNMRKEDVIEVNALGHSDVYKALKESVELSQFKAAVIVENYPVCIVGLRLITLMGDTGIPWLLGTHDIVHYRKELAVKSKEILDEMLTIAPNLFNIVHSENEMNINWLKKLGFSFGEKYPHDGHYFYAFHIGEPNV